MLDNDTKTAYTTWNKTEIKHYHRCSREIAVILFQFYFMLCEPFKACASDSWYSVWRRLLTSVVPVVNGTRNSAACCSVWSASANVSGISPVKCVRNGLVSSLEWNMGFNCGRRIWMNNANERAVHRGKRAPCDRRTPGDHNHNLTNAEAEVRVMYWSLVA